MNSAERNELVGGFDSVLDDLISVEDALQASKTGEWPQGLRPTLADMGFFDLALAESSAGLDLDMRTLASLCLTTGYRLLPPSLVLEALILAPVLEAGGSLIRKPARRAEKRQTCRRRMHSRPRKRRARLNGQGDPLAGRRSRSGPHCYRPSRSNRVSGRDVWGPGHH